MRLKLHNFRCWKDEIFDFSLNEGGNIILLSGKSGAGKSSIFNAVYFCLYGVGNKITTNGTTTPKVELEIDNLVITRSKRPNLLKVHNLDTNVTLENDEAQGVINEKFGDMFLTTSYIKQKNMSSFVMQGPLEKLNILEKIAFQGLELNKKKDKIKSFIKSYEESLIAKQTEIELLKSILDETKPEKVEFPFKTSNKDLAIKNEYTKHKNSITLSKKFTKKLSELDSTINTFKIKNNTYNIKSEELKGIKDKISSLEKKIVEVDFQEEEIYILKQSLDLFSRKKNYLSLKNRYEALFKEYQEIKNHEETTVDKRLKELKNLLWQKETKEDTQNNIEVYKEYLNDMKHLKDLEKLLESTNVDENILKEKMQKLETLKKDIEFKVRLQTELRDVYECPSCKTKLKIKESFLVTLAEVNQVDFKEISTEIIRLKDQKKELDNEIQILKNRKSKNSTYTEQIKNINEKYCAEDYVNVIEDLKEAEDYLKLNIEYTKELEILKSQKNNYLIKLERDVLKLSTELENSYDKEYDKIDVIDEDGCREKLSVLQSKQMKKKILQEQLTQYQKECEKLESILSENPFQDFSELEKELSSVKKSIETCKNDEIKTLENIKIIEKYLDFVEKNKVYEEKIRKLDILTKSEKEILEKLSGMMLLKEKINIAEGISISNLIETINTHVQNYLDYFFEDNPMTAVLKSFKDVKNTKKPTVNILIEYKGMECDVDSLSEGEKDRLILAYTLALAEICKTEILLLDEVISSLDQESTANVVNSLKELYTGKLIILVGHQIVKGSFDKVIEI